MILTLARSEIERWEEIYRENALHHQNNNEHELYEFNQLIADELRVVLDIVDREQKQWNLRFAYRSEFDKMMEAIHYLRSLDWPMLDTVTDAMKLSVPPSTGT